MAVQGRVRGDALGPVARHTGGRGDRQDQADARRRSHRPDRRQHLRPLRSSLVVISEPFALSIAGASVVGVLHLPRRQPAPCVIACHGMGASKDSDKYLLLAQDFPEAGLALARFDFRGSGESGGLGRNATIASRIADVEAVLEHLEGHPALNGRFGLLGSSLGGYVALWAASRRRAAVTTWCRPSMGARSSSGRGSRGSSACFRGPIIA